MSDVLRLEPRLTHDAAVRLWGACKDRRDQDIALDASDVRHVSGSALQVFLSIRRLADLGGKTLTIDNPTHAFEEKLRLLGAERLLSGEIE